jgi:hypothetical protein
MDTFIPFEVSKATFEDLRLRLDKREMLWKHLSKDSQGREVIIFGATAFRVETGSKLFSRQGAI